MKKGRGATKPSVEWSRIPYRIRRSLRGLGKSGLDLRGGSQGWSIRENVHHLVEANLVASNMIIAALATDGCDFDWTWVNPGSSWMRKVGYDRAAVDPAIEALDAVCRHISRLIAGQPGGLARRVRLNDAPGAKRYARTVETILRHEAEHAGAHLDEIRATRRRHSR